MLQAGRGRTRTRRSEDESMAATELRRRLQSLRASATHCVVFVIMASRFARYTTPSLAHSTHIDCYPCSFCP